MFDRIVLITDLSDVTRKAFAPVADLAKRRKGVRVVLLHAVVGSTEQYFLDDAIRAKIDEKARAKAREPLDDMARDLAKLGVDVEPVLEVGSPFNVLPEVVNRYEAQLVIIPTHGHHSLLRRVSNSVTARAIRDHVVPVLIVNEHFDADAWSGFGPVTHPVDFGKEQRSGLRTAEDFAFATGGALRLVHVLRPLNLASIYDEDERELRHVIQSSQEAQLTQVEAALADVLSGVERVTGESAVIVGEAAGQAICEDLAASGAGSVVLPALGRDSVRTQLMGSVAEHVILHAPCPVLVFDGPLGS